MRSVVHSLGCILHTCKESALSAITMHVRRVHLQASLFRKIFQAFISRWTGTLVLHELSRERSTFALTIASMSDRLIVGFLQALGFRL